MTQRNVWHKLVSPLCRKMATACGFLALVALLGWAVLAPGPVAAQTAGPTPTAVATPPSGGEVQLGIQKTVAPATVPTGSRLTYTILVNNRGPSDAHNVVVSDTLPDQLQPISVTTTKGEAALEGQVVTVRIDSLAPGELVTITIVAVVKAGTVGGQTVTNMAQVISAESRTPSMSSVDALISQTPLPQSGESDASLPLLLLLVLALCVGSGLLLRRRRPSLVK